MANPLLEQIKKLSEEDKAELAKLLKGAGIEIVPGKKYVYGGRFWTTVSRYVNGRYVTATPDIPQLVKFDKKLRIEVDDDGNPLDKSLIPAKAEAPQPPKPANLIQPFHKKRTGPPVEGEQAEDDGKRPSDEDPAK